MFFIVVLSVVPQPVYMNASELRQQQQQHQQQQQQQFLNGDNDQQQLIYTTSLVSCTIYDDGQGILLFTRPNSSFISQLFVEVFIGALASSLSILLKLFGSYVSVSFNGLL